MTKHTYTATTEIGTFTRTTARTYSHIVVSVAVSERTGKGYATVEWCGRLDLAVSKAATNAAMRYATEADYAKARRGVKVITRGSGAPIYTSVRIFAVDTGAEVAR